MNNDICISNTLSDYVSIIKTTIDTIVDLLDYGVISKSIFNPINEKCT